MQIFVVLQSPSHTGSSLIYEVSEFQRFFFILLTKIFSVTFNLIFLYIKAEELSVKRTVSVATSWLTPLPTCLNHHTESSHIKFSGNTSFYGYDDK